MNFPGNCYFNHSKKRVWIDIPKNASKTIGHHLRRSKDWKNGNYIEEGIYSYNAYAVIRDPIKRWRGSTIEIAFHHLQYNNFNYDLLPEWFMHKDWKNFEKRHDLHHLTVDYFTKGLENITWIPLNRNFEELVKTYLEIEEPLEWMNSTEENEHKKRIEPYVDELLDDSAFISKLKDYYRRDFEIFERSLSND